MSMNMTKSDWIVMMREGVCMRKHGYKAKRKMSHPHRRRTAINFQGDGRSLALEQGEREVCP
jgi:hypothetical protein